MDTPETNTTPNPEPQVNTAVPSGTQEAPVKEDNHTLMAALSYVSILVLIPYLTAKENPFVKFHIKQGLVLLVIEVAVYVLSMLMWMLIPILGVINLILIVLSVIGIINVVQGKEKEIPFIGQFSKHFNI